MIQENVSHSISEGILSEIITGLKSKKKYLPFSLLFEADNSLLERLMCSEEYYIARSEAKLLSRYIDEICAFIGENPLIIDFSCGDRPGSRILFDHIYDIAAYVPVDTCSRNIESSIEILQQEYPHLEIKPVSVNVNEKFKLPQIDNQFEKKVFILPDSRIGRFSPFEVKAFLKRIIQMYSENDLFFVGVDLKKEKHKLEKVYNKRNGIISQLNFNILTHLNEVYGQIFNPDNFEHFAFYNDILGRIEMYLVNTIPQKLELLGDLIYLDENEKILTQYFYKYSQEEFEELVNPYFEVHFTWLDKVDLYSLQLLKAVE